MKALDILKKAGIQDFTIERFCLDEAIKELEGLENRSCESCEYDYIDIDENCERCTRYYDDKWEQKK